MLLALAGDQAHFLAAVPVSDRLAERLLDHAALPIVQGHRGGDHPVRADSAGTVLADECREQIERMGMAKQQTRRMAAQMIGKAAQPAAIDAEGVQEALTIHEKAPQARFPPAPLRFAVAPQSGHPRAELPPAPLVGPERARPLPRLRLLVPVDSQRDTSRARGRFRINDRVPIRLGTKLGCVRSDVRLGQHREARQVVERPDGVRPEPG
jgi:hypothetical protein